MKKIDKAWITFLSSNNYYIYMLLGLYKNLLDTKTKYPIYCGVTSEVTSETREILCKVGLNLIEIDTSIFSNTIMNNSRDKTCQHYHQAFTKLALLSSNIETKFNKIVYIDSDVQVLENIDELFDCPHLSAIKDNFPRVDTANTPYKLGCSKFCSGLFIWDFKNNPGKGQYILNNLNKLDLAIGWHDQNVLNYFYQDWINQPELHLSATYGLMNSKINFTKFKASPKAIHYTGRLKKGWPFEQKTNLFESNWNGGNINFKNWVRSLAKTVDYFILKYKINIPKLHPENIKLVSEAERKSTTYMGGPWFSF